MFDVVGVEIEEKFGFWQKFEHIVSWVFYFEGLVVRWSSWQMKVGFFGWSDDREMSKFLGKLGSLFDFNGELKTFDVIFVNFDETIRWQLGSCPVNFIALGWSFLVEDI